MPTLKKGLGKGNPPARGKGKPRGIYTTAAREARQSFADEAYWVKRDPSGWRAQGYTRTAGGWEPREWGAASSDASGGRGRRREWEAQIVA